MRVIAGTYKGRPLSSPPGLGTRPTAARVREALFSVLGDLSGANVLDLYAGSGALGIEALSRGARAATFVESAKAPLSCLRSNISQLGLSAHAKVLPIPAERSLSALRAGEPFDFVFCDPPWADASRALSVLARLAEAGILGGSAQVLLEHAARDSIEPSNDGPLAVSATRRWGDTAITTLVPVSRPTGR